MPTLDELKAMKKKWYEEACSSGIIDRAAKVCRELGSSLNHRYGPKYEYINGTVRIYVDDWGHYMDVTVDGKTVCSTHPCHMIFIPGPWTSAIEAAHQAAIEVQEGKRADQNERERLQLARDLGIE